MKYFVASGEDRQLDAFTRKRLRGSFIDLGDGTTHYELAGSGTKDIVVMIGGLTIPLFYWDGLASRLQERGFGTLAYSCYGRGYSDRVRDSYGESLFVRQLSELTQRLGIERFHLIGTSMGALIAMAYAAQHAGTLVTLTLAGPAGLGAKPALPPWLTRRDWLMTFVARRFGQRLLKRHLSHNVQDPQLATEAAQMILDAYRYRGAMYALFSTMRNFPLSGRAELFRHTQSLNVPTLLVWGENDLVTPISQLEIARDLLKPQQCDVIKGCGHMAPFERPREVASLIAGFTAAHTIGLDS
ncbi:alpha/beta fold hydrolase [Burkholderia cenocepacia]|uniref:alpha/beta fold hydrolase n=1 Tax=Burkholderia cenocepacia TaxID=95486 RepID=UPI00158E1102|nr:alpha/beta hydrolase [Burkholderia cenocepacia]